MKFVMDGHIDLNTLATELYDNGVNLHTKDIDNAKEAIAVVLSYVLRRIKGATQSRRAVELHDAITGIVQCAEDEGLIYFPDEA